MRTREQWMIYAAHLRQQLGAQRRSTAHFERRARKAEADVTYYAGLYEEVLRLCARAGFNPYQYENAEGQD